MPRPQLPLPHGRRCRDHLVAELRDLLAGHAGERAVDLRTLADCWLTAISPYWQEHLARRRRHRPVRIRDVEPVLVREETQIPTEDWRACFEGVPLWMEPLDKRIVAAIVGMP